MDFILDSDFHLWLLEVNGSPKFKGHDDEHEKFLIHLLKDKIEIEYAYLRSKMKRLYAVVEAYYMELHTVGASLQEAKSDFAKASTNRLEPEWNLRSNITWQKVLDESIPGKGAYMGLLKDECILDRS